MYTSSSDHIIIHQQSINAKNYIRIVSTTNTQSYFEEIQKAYGVQVENTDIAILYNSGDLFERLVHDLHYKKFKGIQTNEICSGLWCVEGATNIDQWCKTTYLPWITNKLQSYIDDMDEEDYLTFHPKDIDWYGVNKNKLVTTIFDDFTKYKILDVEINVDGKYVASRDHILSIALEYVNNNHACIIGLENNNHVTNDETSTQESKLEIKTIEHLRGVVINKNILTTQDIKDLFDYLHISKEVLKEIVSCKTYMKIMENVAITKNVIYETSAFDSKYYFIDDSTSCQQCDNLIDLVFAPMICQSTEPTQSSSKDTQVSKQSTKVIYKNLINDQVNVVDVELTFLAEFKRLSSFSYCDHITNNVLDTINKKMVSNDLVQELKQLISILEKGEVMTCDADDNTTENARPTKEWSLQKLNTKAYVDLYKNDTMETLASTVIENVYEYLSQCQITEQINKNQIGKDLVDLGVKKTRKAKGYVYGIEDTKEKKSTTIKLEADHSKVEKENHQIRSLPQPINIDPQVYPQVFGCPGKFLVPRAD